MEQVAEILVVAVVEADPDRVDAVAVTTAPAEVEVMTALSVALLLIALDMFTAVNVADPPVAHWTPFSRTTPSIVIVAVSLPHVK